MKKSYLIPIFVGLVIVIFGFPLLFYVYGKTTFYSIDPDVVYITNALLYTKYHIISYADHPGTPTIMLLYYLFFPLRLASKYLFHQNFIQWSFDNYPVLTYYSRVLELILTGAALYIYLKIVKKISDSCWITLFAGLSALAFTGMESAIRIVPENLALFLGALWLAVFSVFTKKRTYLLNIILVFIGGFAVANKFTSLFLLIVSIFLVLFVKKLKFDQKFARFQFNIVIAWFGFYLGILPAWGKFTYIKNWAIELFTHSGTHGTGSNIVFDMASYLESSWILIKSNPFFSTFILFAIILPVALIFKRKIKLSDPLVFLNSVALSGLAVFAKYPLMYYNSLNIFLIIFCTAYFLSKANIMLTKIFIPIIFLASIITINAYIKDVTKYLNNGISNDVYKELNAWTPYWASDIFREQLDGSNPVKNVKP